MTNNKTTVKVIDQIMGSGKTTWAIQYMNAHKDKSFVFCTPFLDEIKRIKDETKKGGRYGFVAPSYVGGKTKAEDFNKLLMEGKDIGVTHSTFQNSTTETYEYIKEGNYCLILDECLDVLLPYNEACNDTLRKGDPKFLLDQGVIEVDSFGRVKWVLDTPFSDTTFDKLKAMIQKGNVFFLRNKFLVWQFPPPVFEAFNEIYVLTYMFEGSVLCPYFKAHGIPYEYLNVSKSEDGIYELCEWQDDKDIRAKLRQLIDIFNNKGLNNRRGVTLSKTWCEKADPEDIKILKNDLKNYLKNYKKADAKDIMWTCYSDLEKKLSGKGYTIANYLSKQEAESIEKEHGKEALVKRRAQEKCFVPCNSKATNIYRDRSVLAYLVHIRMSPDIEDYFKKKNITDGTNIKIDTQKHTLSCLIQWVWRSRIRDNMPISIFIPAKKVRDLFEDWLSGKI